jgi:dCMP deaminase
MNRPNFENIFMDFAASVAKRSTCARRQVGCVITSTDFRYVYGIGYNGNAVNMPNQCDDPDASGKCGCLHAEDNAVTNCREDREKPKFVFVTVFPCRMCAKRLANLGGVSKIFFKDDYHDELAVEVFNRNAIEFERITSDDRRKT